MRIPAHVLALAGLLAGLPAGAQSVPSSLSLDEAIELARANNPVYRQVLNDRDLADWEVRRAYGQLLPTASASSGVTWQGAGEQQFGTLTLGDLGFGNLPSYYLSTYRLSVGYNLDWSTLKGPASAKAQRAATDADIRLSEASLVSQVTGAYLEVLRAAEGVRLAEQQRRRAGRSAGGAFRSGRAPGSECPGHGTHETAPADGRRRRPGCGVIHDLRPLRAHLDSG
jgi:outer membrane protein TolC